jgi:hypothetical protein
MSEDEEEADELPEATGYHYTHWDCPVCSDANEKEGDAKAEILECWSCGAKARIR